MAHSLSFAEAVSFLHKPEAYPLLPRRDPAKRSALLVFIPPHGYHSVKTSWSVFSQSNRYWVRRVQIRQMLGNLYPGWLFYGSDCTLSEHIAVLAIKRLRECSRSFPKEFEIMIDGLVCELFIDAIYTKFYLDKDGENNLSRVFLEVIAKLEASLPYSTLEARGSYAIR